MVLTFGGQPGYGDWFGECYDCDRLGIRVNGLVLICNSTGALYCADLDSATWQILRT